MHLQLHLSLFLSQKCASTPVTSMQSTALFYMFARVSLSGFTLNYSFCPLFQTHSYTHLIPLPFILQRDLWLVECWRQVITMFSSVRQSVRGGTSDIHWPFTAAHSPPARLPILTLLQWLLRLPRSLAFDKYWKAALLSMWRQ